jgi:hypothetical protein
MSFISVVVQGFFDDAVGQILGSIRKQLDGTKAKVGAMNPIVQANS